MTHYKLNTKYKDRLFRLIFHEKKELLELYNAVNESNYTNPEELEITTIEDVMYMGMKNDLSFIIGNGKGKKSSLECTALLLNVNYGHNKELMERCKTLKEYAQFIAAIRTALKPGMKEEEAHKAVEQTVDKCIRENILANILCKNRSEIVDSILTEWDEDDFIEGVREEAEERGKIAGEIKGKIELCQEFHVSKEDTLDRIVKEFSLEEAKAKKYMEEYWKQEL